MALCSLKLSWSVGRARTKRIRALEEKTVKSSFMKVLFVLLEKIACEWDVR